MYLEGTDSKQEKSTGQSKPVITRLNSDFVKNSFGSSTSVTVKVQDGIINETGVSAMDEFVSKYNAERAEQHRRKRAQALTDKPSSKVVKSQVKKNRKSGRRSVARGSKRGRGKVNIKKRARR